MLCFRLSFECGAPWVFDCVPKVSEKLLLPRLCGRSRLFWLMFLGDATIININVLKSPVACFWTVQSYANVNLDPF